MAPSQLSYLVVLSLLLALLYLVSIAAHTLYFHPLARYPGPFLAKFTNAYAAYHGWKGDIHLDMWRCHKRYGDHVRYAPNSLLFNNVRALNEIYGMSSKVIKSKGYAPMVHIAPNTLTIRGGKDHARRRRILAQGLSQKAQRDYEPRIVENIQKLCNVVLCKYTDFSKSCEKREWSGPIDMARYCNYLTFDIMADVVFGARYNLLGDPKFRYVCDTIDKSNVRMSALVQAPKLAALNLDKHIFRDAIKARSRFVKFVLRVVEERMQRSCVSPDLFANLAIAKDTETGSSFNPDEIGAESTTLIVAGSDTSATTIAASFFYLAHNTFAYARAAEEIRNMFKTPEEIVMGTALASCVYLRACIDESMRMSPAVGSSLWREVPDGGAVIDGHEIPAGTDVGVGIYSIHHNPEYYPEPFSYRPERWLAEGAGHKQGESGIAHAAFTPFSFGMRGCLGKGLALTEISLTLATVLFTFDFKLAEGEAGRVGEGRSDAVYGRHRPGEYQLYDHITSQKHGPVLQFSVRN